VRRLLARGEDTPGIAEQLGIRTPTVRNHMRRLLRKLGAHSRLEAVVMAVRAGLVKV
jgi:DNA-binding NarL/FixJ family response regulator